MFQRFILDSSSSKIGYSRGGEVHLFEILFNRRSIQSSKRFSCHNIVNSHFGKLPVVYNDDDTTKLRELYDKIKTNLRSLRAIGIQADTYGCILVPMLKNKLPK